MTILDDARQHAQETYPPADWPHILEVTITALVLAQHEGADAEIVTLAALFHDISRPFTGVPNHHTESARMAQGWLTAHGYPEPKIQRVCDAIIAHMRPVETDQSGTLAVESRILYDADKISRAQGLGLISALVRLGSPVTWEGLSYPDLKEAILQGRSATQAAYDTLFTTTARELAREGWGHAIAFCDSILALTVFDPPHE